MNLDDDARQMAEDVLCAYPYPWPAPLARAIAALKGFDSLEEMLADNPGTYEIALEDSPTA